MVKSKTASATDTAGPASSSFLVRIWREPRRDRKAGEPMRFFVRNLRTGEEHYLGDPALLLDQLVPGSAEKDEPLKLRREADAG